MEKTFIGCSMLDQEINQVLKELGIENDIVYIDAALHVDLDKLEQALRGRLDIVGQDKEPVVLVGSKCHPDIGSIVGEYKGRIICGGNCIELLIGPKLQEFDGEAKTFYVTAGWLKNWKRIFIEGLNWDPVEARINFGWYDRIMLIDTGLNDIADEDILEFFEYTQVPLEFYSTGLDHLKKEIIDVISR
ncbi:MAG: hypothetical protein CVU89_11330 [Firmicutes bacterium HGW-Firmicutes-14]|jgi:hypothetical protein|nr:MAG: hypothetical protein CVU89_11330 [Firmicutes bacterium HGW-Firmicutes-14]